MPETICSMFRRAVLKNYCLPEHSSNSPDETTNTLVKPSGESCTYPRGKSFHVACTCSSTAVEVYTIVLGRQMILRCPPGAVYDPCGKSSTAVDRTKQAEKPTIKDHQRTT